MTISVLRRLHEIIGHAIDDIERVYAAHADDPRSAPTSKRSSPIPTATQTQSPTPPESECGDAPSATSPATTASQAHTFKGRQTHLSSPSNSGAYASPPPSPSVANIPGAHTVSPISSKESPKESCREPQLLSVDFPSLDAPYDGGSLSEILTTHPTVLEAVGKIVAAAGQLSAMAQTPFLTLCEAIMAYHLPSCMRLLEASHVVEILREAGPGGLHVQLISRKNGVAANKLAHVLRLLATHHLLREVSPDVFALNRLSSLVDSGKTFEQIKTFEKEGRPEMKYTNTNGIAAFVGLCTDEIQKSSAYLTETYYLSPSASTRAGADPVRAPFCFAFDTAHSGTGFFGWLEGEAGVCQGSEGNSDRQRAWTPAPPPPPPHPHPRQAPPPSSARYAHDRTILGRAGQDALGDRPGQVRKKRATSPADPPGPPRTEADAPAQETRNPNRFRLERFGKAMSGTDGWEVPGAVLSGFDWASLAGGSVIVDVGGGIGSTSMILATAFAQENAECGAREPLKFVIQDRAVVCAMGEKAWKAKCPELLDATVQFQVHDFFTPQPVKDAAVFLLRVVLHDWPDDFARKILLRLREAATPETKLLIADFVLPLACPDDTSSTGGLEGVEGAESVLAPAPLLPNLGKASANGYWMDLTMQVMFNSQERTLREMVTLTLSAGWKIVKVTKTPGSLFGYLVAVPVPIPDAPTAAPGATAGVDGPAPHTTSMSAALIDEPGLALRALEREQLHRDTSSRCGTPTFGSHMRLSSASETLSRLGSAALLRSRATIMRSASSPSAAPRTPPTLKPALSLSASTGKKKKPSPLSVPPASLLLHGSPTPAQSPRRTPSLTTSPKIEGERSPLQVPAPAPVPRTIARRMSLAAVRSPSAHGLHITLGPPPPIVPPLPCARTPLSPNSGATRTLTRRASQAGLAPLAARSPVPPLPRPGPMRTGPNTEPVSPGSSTQRSPQRLQAGASPVPPPRTPGALRRRASSAQLPQAMGRRRAGTVAGDGILRAGTVLRFDAPMLPSAREEAKVAGEPSEPGVGVLAAAARIAEHGERQGPGAQDSP